MWILLGILFLLCGCIYATREILLIRRVNDLYIISFVRLLYACSYGFFPAILCFLYVFQGIKVGLASLVVIRYDNQTLESMFLFLIFSVVGYIALSFGYRSIGNKVVRFKISKYSTKKIGELCDKQIFWIGAICLIIGITAFLIWTSDMGGIQKYMELASAIRGDYKNVYGNTHMGWRKIARVLLPSTYIFYFLCLKNKKKRISHLLLFIISIGFAVLFLICNDGRLTTTLFFMILIVGYFRYGERRDKNIKKQLFQFVLLLLVAFLLLANLDNISYFIRHQGRLPELSSSNKDGVLVTLMNEFSYIYKSGTTSVENCFPNGKLMFIDDIMFGLTTYMPGGSILGSYTQVSLYNTILCTGNVNSIAGSIPCDMISLSLYDLGYIGPIIIPFIIGLVIRIIENYCHGKKNNPLCQTFYYGWVLIFIRVVNYFEVYDFITSLFPYIVLWIVSITINWSNLLLKRR